MQQNKRMNIWKRSMKKMNKFLTRKKDKQVFPTGKGKEIRRNDDYEPDYYATAKKYPVKSGNQKFLERSLQGKKQYLELELLR